MKTRKEIDDLKHNWNMDACWDIETTEGFEEHKDELLLHRLTMQEKWSKLYDDELLKFSQRIGTGSQKLELWQRITLKDCVDMICGMSFPFMVKIFGFKEAIHHIHTKMKMEGFDV